MSTDNPQSIGALMIQLSQKYSVSTADNSKVQ
jgi:hypothetical protein